MKKYFLIGALSLVFPIIAYAQSGLTCGYNGFNMMGAGGWGIIFPLFWLLVFGGIIAIIAKGLTRNIPPAHKTDSALEILQNRYAKGEISREKYEEMRRDIGR